MRRCILLSILSFMFLQGCLATMVTSPVVTDTASGLVSQGVNALSSAEKAPCPRQHTFDSDYNSVWEAAIRAVNRHLGIGSFSQSTGRIVTQYGMVPQTQLDIAGVVKTFTNQDGLTAKEKLFQQVSAVLGATGTIKDQFNHTLRFSKRGSKKTCVTVSTHIKKNQALPDGQTKDYQQVENALRKNMFVLICKELYPYQQQNCASMFSSPILTVDHQSIQQTNQSHTHTGSTRKKGNETVRQVQHALTDLGYSPGPIDGLMGPKTRKAIKNFQKAENIAVTGKTDKNTLIALNLKEGVVQYQNKIVPKSPSESDTPASEPYIRFVTSADLMPGKDPFATPIARISEGTVLKYDAFSQEWYQVEYNGQIGFVFSSSVQKQSDPGPPPKVEKVQHAQDKTSEMTASSNDMVPQAETVKTTVSQAVYKAGKVIETTSLLAEPELMSSSTTSVSKGQKVEIIDRKEAFYKVRYDSYEGYIYCDFIQLM